VIETLALKVGHEVPERGRVVVVSYVRHNDRCWIGRSVMEEEIEQ